MELNPEITYAYLGIGELGKIQNVIMKNRIRVEYVNSLKLKLKYN